MSQFEKTFPRSSRLMDGYLLLMSAYARRNDGLHTVGYGDKAVQTNSSNVRTLLEVSRTYASLQAQTSQMDKALAYAEKAVTLSKGLKVQGPPRGMRPAEWQQWTASMEVSAQKNLAWVQQVASWHQRSLFSLMAPTRR